MSALKATNLQHVLVRGKKYTSFEIWEDRQGGYVFSGVFKIPGWYKKSETVMKKHLYLLSIGE